MKRSKYKDNLNIAGERLALARRRKKLTQGELAAKVQTYGLEQFDQKSVSLIETGKRYIVDYELMILSEILDVTYDWLIEEWKERIDEVD